MTVQPVIIRKKKVNKGDGHHGGAWKVAYADFVTAMMAFFLLMWLLNATTEEQRKGIADYFDPSVPVSPVSGGGTDVLSGDTVYATDSLAYNNHGGDSSDQAAEHELVTSLTASLEQSLAQDQFSVTLSDEGIVIELMEADDAPLFTLGNAEPSPLLQRAVASITKPLLTHDRPIRLIGHTDALKFRHGTEYTNWELSSERANAARRLMVANAFPVERLDSVVGKADKMPLVQDRRAPQNRRISVIVLNADESDFGGALEGR